MRPQSHLQEFEYDMDVLNLVFGAALGGYVGVVMATENLPNGDLWLLMLLLASVASFLLTVREVAKAIFGLPYFGIKFPWSINLALVLGVGIQLMALLIPTLVGEKFSIIFRAWVAVLVLYLLTGYLRTKKWKKD